MAEERALDKHWKGLDRARESLERMSEARRDQEGFALAKRNNNN